MMASRLNFARGYGNFNKSVINSTTLFFSQILRHQITARDQRVTSMICTICLCYLACNAPFVAVTLSGVGRKAPIVRKITENVFFMQYTLNFVVYAASNKQYREAYLFFLGRAFGRSGSGQLAAPNALGAQESLRHRGHRRRMEVAVTASSAQSRSSSDTARSSSRRKDS